MNVPKILKELRRERDLIDQAIAAVERLLASRPRRGRPPKYFKTDEQRGRSRKKKALATQPVAA